MDSLKSFWWSVNLGITDKWVLVNCTTAFEISRALSSDWTSFLVAFQSHSSARVTSVCRRVELNYWLPPFEGWAHKSLLRCSAAFGGMTCQSRASPGMHQWTHPARPVSRTLGVGRAPELATKHSCISTVGQWCAQPAGFFDCVASLSISVWPSLSPVAGCSFRRKQH